MYTIVEYNSGDDTYIRVRGVTQTLESAKQIAAELANRNAAAWPIHFTTTPRFDSHVHCYADAFVVDVKEWDETQWTHPDGDEYSTFLRGDIQGVYVGYSRALEHTRQWIETWIRQACAFAAASSDAATVETFVDSLLHHYADAGTRNQLKENGGKEWGALLTRLADAGFQANKEIAMSALAPEPPDGSSVLRDKWGYPVAPWGELEDYCAKLVNWLWVHNVAGLRDSADAEWQREHIVKFRWPEHKFMVSFAPMLLSLEDALATTASDKKKNLNAPREAKNTAVTAV